MRNRRLFSIRLKWKKAEISTDNVHRTPDRRFPLPQHFKNLRIMNAAFRNMTNFETVIISDLLTTAANPGQLDETKKNTICQKTAFSSQHMFFLKIIQLKTGSDNTNRVLRAS